MGKIIVQQPRSVNGWPPPSAPKNWPNRNEPGNKEILAAQGAGGVKMIRTTEYKMLQDLGADVVSIR